MEILWKYIETVGINVRARGKVYLQIKLYCENTEQLDQHQGGGEVQTFKRKMTKDICKSRLTLNSGYQDTVVWEF